ncbi:MAG: cupin [Oculatellaceae cyanobacterium Prado106]|jgi:predicted metal-dependent enzyme (double-stranded beta helix superfamily)|nr:cupin [Oculatellaceae cyanobacterium Prado106]
MTGQNYFVTAAGHCLDLESLDPEPLSSPTVFSTGSPHKLNLKQPYRLYRFLTDLEDILDRVPDEPTRLSLILPLVRHLLTHSEWLHMNFSPPDPVTGWSVLMLYDEPDYPITVQTVVWSPGSVSPIHNHGTWGVVALLHGQEKNRFWQRSPTSTHADHITPTQDHLLFPGDILGLTSEAIHQVEAIGDEPTISFNVYGETNYEQRFEFDPVKQTAIVF